MKMKRLFVLFCFLFLLITLYAGKPVRKDKILYSCSYMRMDDFTEKSFGSLNVVLELAERL